jgi:hypothetical protein
MLHCTGMAVAAAILAGDKDGRGSRLRPRVPTHLSGRELALCQAHGLELPRDVRLLEGAPKLKHQASQAVPVAVDLLELCQQLRRLQA